MESAIPAGFWKKIGRSAWESIYMAGVCARTHGSDITEVSHLLLSLLNQQDRAATLLFNQSTVDVSALRHQLQEQVGPITQEAERQLALASFLEDGGPLFEGSVAQDSDRVRRSWMAREAVHRLITSPSPPYSDDMNGLLVLAADVALRTFSTLVEPEHLLIAMASTTGKEASQLKSAGFDAEAAIALVSKADFPVQRPDPPHWRRIEQLIQVKNLAQEYAAANHRTGITPEDLLSALATLPNTTAVRLFERAGVDRQALIVRLGSVRLMDERALNARQSDIKLIDESKALLNLADAEAQRRGRSESGFEDLFLAVLASGKGTAYEALTEQGMELDACRRLFDESASGAGTEQERNSEGTNPEPTDDPVRAPARNGGATEPL